MISLLISCNEKDTTVMSDNINYTNDSEIYSNFLQGIDYCDAFFLNSSQRDGKYLFLEVSYSGGCEIHDFNVIWDGNILESNPPQAYIFITHNANGDACEAFINESLTVDLTRVFGDFYSDDLKLIILNGSE